MAKTKEAENRLVKLLDIIIKIDAKSESVIKNFDERFETIGKHKKLLKELIDLSSRIRRRFSKNRKERIEELVKEIKEDVLKKFNTVIGGDVVYLGEEKRLIIKENLVLSMEKDIFRHDYWDLQRQLSEEGFRGEAGKKIRNIAEKLRKDFADEVMLEKINLRIMQAIKDLGNIISAMNVALREEIEVLNCYLFDEYYMTKEKKVLFKMSETKLLKLVNKIARLQKAEKNEGIDIIERLMKEKRDINEKIRSAVSELVASKKGRNKITIDDIKSDLRRLTSKPEEVHRYFKELNRQRHLLHPRAMEFLDRVEDRSYFKFKQEGMMDMLTRIGNREAFNREIVNLSIRSERNKKPFSLIMGDIDEFRKFNNNYGHMAGDLVLSEVARIMGDSLIRKQDTVFRYGGEEIVVLLPDTPKEGASEVAERIRKDIETQSYETMIDINNRFPAKGRRLDNITISLGVAEFPTDTPDSAELIEKADKALYKAKRAGRNRVMLFRTLKQLV